MCRPSTLSSSLPAPGACTAAALLHRSAEQLPEPTDGLQSTSQGIMPLINQPSMLRAMNYLSHLHFVGEGWRRGLASGEDHDDEDSDEEEGQDSPHHSSGHGDGVRPLRLRLVCGKVQTLWASQTCKHRHEWVKGKEPKACCHRGESRNVQILWGVHSKLLKLGIFVKLTVTVQHVPARGHVNNSNISLHQGSLMLCKICSCLFLEDVPIFVAWHFFTL